MAEPLSEFFNGKLRGTTIDQLLAEGMDVEFFEDEDIETSDDVKDLMNAVERVPSLPIGDVEKIRRRLKRKFEDSTSSLTQSQLPHTVRSAQEATPSVATTSPSISNLVEPAPALPPEQHTSTPQPSSSEVDMMDVVENRRLQGVLDALCSVEHLVDVYKIPEGNGDVSGQSILTVVGSSIDITGKIVSGCHFCTNQFLPFTCVLLARVSITQQLENLILGCQRVLQNKTPAYGSTQRITSWLFRKSIVATRKQAKMI